MLKDTLGWAIEILALIGPACCVLAFAQSVRIRVDENLKRQDSQRTWLSGVSVIQIGILGFMVYGAQWPHFTLFGLVLLLWMMDWIKGRGTFVAFYLAIFAGPVVFESSPLISSLKYPLDLSSYEFREQLAFIAALIAGMAMLFRWLGVFVNRTLPHYRESPVLRQTGWKILLTLTLLTISFTLRWMTDAGVNENSTPVAFLTDGILVGAVLAAALSALGHLDYWYQSLTARRRDELSVYIIPVYGAAFLGLILLQDIAGQPVLIIAHVAMAAIIACDPDLKLRAVEEKMVDEAASTAPSPESGAAA